MKTDTAPVGSTTPFEAGRELYEALRAEARWTIHAALEAADAEG